MEDMETRVQRAIEEISGNEALLEMLDTDAASAMLEWGSQMVKFLVQRTEGMNEKDADQILLPRLKAVRQSIRAVGNWAAGKYADSESRVQLRDKLLENFRSIFGETAALPSSGSLEAVLNEVDDKNYTPLQLILKLKSLLQESSQTK